MKKFLGSLLGFALSLGGVVVWFLLEIFTGFIASAAAYLMVALFFVGYKLVVRQPKTDAFVCASFVVFFNIIVINAIWVLLFAEAEGMSFMEYLAVPDYLGETILYMILPLIFGGLGIFSYYSKFKKDCAIQAQAEKNEQK
jgi:hypothetical protein